MTYPWHIRPASGGSDRCYIVQTWRASLRSMAEHRDKSQGEFRRTVDDVIDALLDRHDTRALVAAPSAADRITIAGWFVFSMLPGVLVAHYLYTRKAARSPRGGGPSTGGGCATRLAAAAGVGKLRLCYTWRGPAASWLLARFPDAGYLEPSTITGKER